jgi:hypothetical protein
MEAARLEGKPYGGGTGPGGPPERASRPLVAGVLLVILLGLALRLAILSRPLPVLDNLFFPDDTFISLQAARNIVAGHGWTLDGEHYTNGFQPLHVFGLAALIKLLGDALLALRVSLGLFALLDALAAWLIFRLLRQATGSGYAGLFGAGLWSLSPGVIANTFCGLETPLVPVGMLLVFSGYRNFIARPGTARGAALGLALALLMLARVDALLFAVALGLDYLLQRRLGRESLRAALPVLAGFLALALPWWAYNLWRFGNFLPESGQVVRDLALWHRQQGHLGFVGLTKVGFGQLLEVPLPLKPLLKLVPPLWSALVLAMPLLVGLAAWQGLRADRSRALRPFLIHLCLLLAFYLGYLQAFWFYRRYLHPAFLTWTLLLGFLVARLDAWQPRLGRGLRPAAALLALALCVPTLRVYLAAEVRHTLDTGIQGAKGYYGVALAAAPLLPSGTRIGALQSGALSFVLDRRTVVNLDGVVNAAAARAIRQKRLASYIREERLDYILDWDLNVQRFLPDHSREGRGLLLQHVADLPPQGPDVFRLYRLRSAAPGGNPGATSAL